MPKEESFKPELIQKGQRDDGGKARVVMGH